MKNIHERLFPESIFVRWIGNRIFSSSFALIRHREDLCTTDWCCIFSFYLIFHYFIREINTRRNSCHVLSEWRERTTPVRRLQLIVLNKRRSWLGQDRHLICFFITPSRSEFETDRSRLLLITKRLLLNSNQLDRGFPRGICPGCFTPISLKLGLNLTNCFKLYFWSEKLFYVEGSDSIYNWDIDG